MTIRGTAIKLSIVAFMSAMGVANAQDGAVVFATLPASNFAFCLGTQASVMAAPLGSNEIGMVITNVGNSITNSSGTVVVAANNKYGADAGSEWKSNFNIPFSLSGGSCYNVATMAKIAGPSGNAWNCGLTNGSASGSGASFNGTVFVETQYLPIVGGQVVAGVTATLNNAPVVNCPY